MKEENVNLTYVFKCLFSERGKFRYISDIDKSKWGFIVNRMLSKKYPDFAQKLNVRSGDFCMLINLWWIYLGTRPDIGYNSWIWISGSRKSKITNSTIDIVRERYPHLSVDDIEYLQEFHKDIFDEEVKYYKKLKEDYGH